MHRLIKQDNKHRCPFRILNSVDTQDKSQEFYMLMYELQYMIHTEDIKESANPGQGASPIGLGTVWELL